jgi:membrane protease subunit (stomatin/prohibitin family)
MARIFDVVEYPTEMMDELVHRFPESGPADLRMGSQVIVRESQRVVFFRDGNALDTFGLILSERLSMIAPLSPLKFTMFQ